MKNIIQFRNGFVNLPSGKTDNYILAVTVAAELMQFGYVLDKGALDLLSKAHKHEIVLFHDEIITWLKNMTGTDRIYKPFWKGFPDEVMEKSELELWMHQLVHYWSKGSYEPNEWTRVRANAFERPTYTYITAGDENKYLKIFTFLISVNNSLTPDDLEIVKYFVSSGAELRFPPEIPFKETLCTILGMLASDNKKNLEKLPKLTVTDVLRIAVHLSGGDIALPPVPPANIRINRLSRTNPYREAFKFKKFSRSERKYLLSLLEKTNCDARESVLKDSRWIRLGEILHPGEYKTKFPKAYKMFDSIRNTKVKSWYGEVEEAFNTGETPNEKYHNGLVKLAERPGEFFRKLDYLVRSAIDTEKEILFQIINVSAPKVSNKVLFEAFNHFERRADVAFERLVILKGKRKRISLPVLSPLKKDIIHRVQNIIIEAITQKFAQLPSLGKVYLDEELKKIPMPTNMRSMNSALRPIIRGQRVPIGNQNAKVIRAYVHWFDEHGTYDIDLTGTFIGNGKVDHVGWNGHHNVEIGCYSGDIRYRIGACAEYIDINVEKACEKGYKYVILDARNYDGETLAEVTDCVFGYMEREKPHATTLFKPDTLANSVKLKSQSSTTIVAMIDLETREYIFLDIDQDGIPVASENFESIMTAVEPYTKLPTFSVHDLLSIHATTRGQIVKNKEDADTVLEFPQFAESYIETLKWMGI